DAVDDLLGGAAALVVEHLPPDQLDRLGHAVGLAADGAGDVGSVAVPVGAVPAGGVVPDRGAPLELGVAGVDAGVQDVRGHPGAGAGRGVGPVQRQRRLVQPVQAPGADVLGVPVLHLDAEALRDVLDL